MTSFYETKTKAAGSKYSFQTDCNNRTNLQAISSFLLFALIAANSSPQATICLAKTETEKQFEEARALYRVKRGLQARDILTRLSKKPDVTPAMLCLLCDTYLAEGDEISAADVNKTKEIANKALKLDPQWGNAWKILAQLANRDEKFEEAVTLATRALTVKSWDQRAYLQRCMAYRDLGKYDLAYKDISIYSEKYDRSQHMLILKAAMAKALKRPDEAIAIYRLSMKESFSDWVMHRIIEIEDESGRLEDAIKDATVLISKSPNDAESYQIRGKLYTKLNQIDPAIADYSKAIDLEPAPIYLKERALLYKKVGKTREAQADQRRAETTKDIGF